ncbi:copper transporter [Allostreptomyces psammosilenae]|uniref:Copper transporter n=1 Tax=Allostreptomyces psammosilenae TaxID=1892865 RepID=A0A852ZLU4_9ACTN|nr:copper transporter [Allostreptomyces psammosilenae]NYI03369.1 hypothetical protein [Allostreptomyces psammosilenae]
MINFRYHVVSIVAVFLALALGLILGGSLLNQAAFEDLSRRVQDLNEEAEENHEQINELTQAQQYRDSVIRELTPTMVDGTLTGHTTVIVSLPGADNDTVGAMRSVIEEAGGQVSGTVRLSDAWSDPNGDDAFTGPLDTLGLADLAVDGQDDPTAQQRAAQALADAVTGEAADPAAGPADGSAGEASAAPSDAPPGSTDTADPQDGPEQTDGATGTDGTAATGPAPADVLEAFADADLVDIDGDPAAGADTVYVAVPPRGADDSDEAVEQAATAHQGWINLAAAVDSDASATVLAGPASAALERGFLKAVRDDGDWSNSYSTVDSADTPAGQVAAVYTLAAELGGAESGHYGVDDTDGPLPRIPEGIEQ